MGQFPLSLLEGWANFYVIVGSAAGALTGLQFVVITLISNLQIAGSMREIRAFGTPTVIHFCVALLISAIMSAPWHLFSSLGLCLSSCGAIGILYSASVVWHAHKAEYNPDAGDWLWYVAAPIAAYLALLASGILLWSLPGTALFVIATLNLIFLLIGIRNSWDTVTFIAIQRRNESGKSNPS